MARQLGATAVALAALVVALAALILTAPDLNTLPTDQPLGNYILDDTGVRSTTQYSSCDAFKSAQGIELKCDQMTVVDAAMSPATSMEFTFLVGSEPGPSGVATGGDARTSTCNSPLCTFTGRTVRLRIEMSDITVFYKMRLAKNIEIGFAYASIHGNAEQEQKFHQQKPVCKIFSEKNGVIYNGITYSTKSARSKSDAQSHKDKYMQGSEISFFCSPGAFSGVVDAAIDVFYPKGSSLTSELLAAPAVSACYGRGDFGDGIFAAIDYEFDSGITGSCCNSTFKFSDKIHGFIGALNNFQKVDLIQSPHQYCWATSPNYRRSDFGTVKNAFMWNVLPPSDISCVDGRLDSGCVTSSPSSFGDGFGNLNGNKNNAGRGKNELCPSKYAPLTTRTAGMQISGNYFTQGPKPLGKIFYRYSAGPTTIPLGDCEFWPEDYVIVNDIRPVYIGYSLHNETFPDATHLWPVPPNNNAENKNRKMPMCGGCFYSKGDAKCRECNKDYDNIIGSVDDDDFAYSLFPPSGEGSKQPSLLGNLYPAAVCGGTPHISNDIRFLTDCFNQPTCSIDREGFYINKVKGFATAETMAVLGPSCYLYYLEYDAIPVYSIRSTLIDAETGVEISTQQIDVSPQTFVSGKKEQQQPSSEQPNANKPANEALQDPNIQINDAQTVFTRLVGLTKLQANVAPSRPAPGIVVCNVTDSNIGMFQCATDDFGNPANPWEEPYFSGRGVNSSNKRAGYAEDMCTGAVRVPLPQCMPARAPGNDASALPGYDFNPFAWYHFVDDATIGQYCTKYGCLGASPEVFYETQTRNIACRNPRGFNVPHQIPGFTWELEDRLNDRMNATQKYTYDNVTYEGRNARERVLMEQVKLKPPSMVATYFKTWTRLETYDEYQQLAYRKGFLPRSWATYSGNPKKAAGPHYCLNGDRLVYTDKSTFANRLQANVQVGIAGQLIAVQSTFSKARFGTENSKSPQQTCFSILGGTGSAQFTVYNEGDLSATYGIDLTCTNGITALGQGIRTIQPKSSIVMLVPVEQTAVVATSALCSARLFCTAVEDFAMDTIKSFTCDIVLAKPEGDAVLQSFEDLVSCTQSIEACSPDIATGGIQAAGTDWTGWWVLLLCIIFTPTSLGLMVFLCGQF